MKVKIWGSRGSLPSPKTPDTVTSILKEAIGFAYEYASRLSQDEILEKCLIPRMTGFGGNTTCISVSTKSSELIIDAGSGLRMMGDRLMSGPCGKGKGEVHLYFTHYHWDHLMGLPFFSPIFIPGNQIHIYGVEPTVHDIFGLVFQKPFFPVPLEALGATIHVHQIEPRKRFSVGDIQFTPYLLDHPDPCWGVKVMDGNKVLAHCVDTESTRFSREDLGEDLPLYQDVDLMIYDAQYTLPKVVERIDWGHSAAGVGLDLAMREKIPKVIFVHHDPSSSNEDILISMEEARKFQEIQKKTAKRINQDFFKVEWSFGYDGLEINL